MNKQQLVDELSYGAETARSVLSRIWEAYPDWRDSDGVDTMLMDWIDKHLPVSDP